MKKGFLVLAALILHGTLFAQSATDLDYRQLQGACERLQVPPLDTLSLELILDAARTEKSQKLRSVFMGVTTLSALLQNNEARYSVCLQALQATYPQSPATKICSRENFFDLCKECNGLGKKTVTQETNCSQCSNTGRCPKCNGQGQRPGLKGAGPIRCLSCSGTGRCPNCKHCWKAIVGPPHWAYERFRTIEVKCPACKGITPPANTARLSEAFQQLIKEAQVMCQKNSGVQQALAAIPQEIRIEDKADLLERIAREYSDAENITDVRDTLTSLKQTLKTITMVDEAKRRSEETQARISAQEALEEKRIQQIKDAESAQAERIRQEDLRITHLQHLDSIRNSRVIAISIQHLRDFIKENPESPVIMEAKSLLIEKEELAEKERTTKKRNRYLLIGCGVFILFILVSSIKLKT